MRRKLASLVIVLCAGVMTGCGGGSPAGAEREASTPVSVDATKYVLADEPDDAVGVIAARANGQHGDAIVVVGRIGGSTNPWVEGRAAFVLLDASVTVVPNGTTPAENQICMDDCCAIQRAASTTLVKVVDERGGVLPVDSRKLFGMVEDDMVVVQGKVNKDEAGNFVVLASGVYLRK